MAPTPFLYCNSSLLHDLLLTERAFFKKKNAGVVMTGIFFFLRGKIKNVSCYLSVAQRRISGSCAYWTSLGYSQ